MITCIAHHAPLVGWVRTHIYPFVIGKSKLKGKQQQKFMMFSFWLLAIFLLLFMSPYFIGYFHDLLFYIRSFFSFSPKIGLTRPEGITTTWQCQAGIPHCP